LIFFFTCPKKKKTHNKSIRGIRAKPTSAHVAGQREGPLSLELELVNVIRLKLHA